MLKFYTINALALVIFFGLLLTGFFGNVTAWLYLAFVVIWVIITALGSFQIRLNYHFDSLNHNYNTASRYVSITFDDGPHPEFTPKVLALLKKYEAKATFFLIGQNAEKYPELVQEILKEGHSIGNHSYSHSKKFGFFPVQKLVGEMDRCNSVLQKITGREVKMFRPPFGVTNPNLKKALQKTAHTSIGWSKRSLDTTSISKERIISKITTNLKPGDIILLHDGGEKSIAVLEQLLRFLSSQILHSVPVDQLLEIEAYA